MFEKFFKKIVEPKGSNMKCYIICFEVSEERYQAFLEKIKTYPKWAIITRTTCAIMCNNQTTEVRNNLMALLDDADRLFVMPSSHVASWKNSMCKNEWLKENL